ncbi:MAG: hypothetical protein IJ775_00145, partial [Muribaculaceae bacterium]|nr:hypothetical protein [Muribaculaceae bacterium]
MNRDYNRHKHHASEYIKFDLDDAEATPLQSTATATNSEGDRPSEFFFMSFGSGSSGNSAYLGTFTSGILIDAGVDLDHVFGDLQRNGVFPQAVKGIIIT